MTTLLVAVATAVFVSIDDRQRTRRAEAPASADTDSARDLGTNVPTRAAVPRDEKSKPRRDKMADPTETATLDEQDPTLRQTGSMAPELRHEHETRSGAEARVDSDPTAREHLSTSPPRATIARAPQLSERNIVLTDRIRDLAAQRGLDAGAGQGPLDVRNVSAAEWKRRLRDFRGAQSR